MEKENIKQEDKEKRRCTPRYTPICPVNKQLHNSELSRAVAILDRVIGQLGPSDDLDELKRILVNEDIKKETITRKLSRELMAVSTNDEYCNSATKTTKTCREAEATSKELENRVSQGDNSETESPMAKALRLRQEQGRLECEFFVGAEEDLHSLSEPCSKNPGHELFIPIDEFSKKWLPLDYQDDDIVEATRALGAITVRVRVQQNNIAKCGTGWILIVKEYPMWYNKKVCQCKECKNSQTPKTKFAEIIVYTAGHVVTNEVDALNTTCHLFFDRGTTPNKCFGVVPLVGAIRIVSESKGERSDRCEMTFVTHDLDLADKLYNMVKLYRDLNAKVCVKYANITTGNGQSGQELSDNEHTLTIIVSHPHGCSKQVSIGYYTLREEVKDGRDVTMYSYTTATCKGSSGAPVFILNRPAWGMCEHPHHGISGVDPSLNSCCYGLF